MIYEYQCKCGKTHERNCVIGQQPKSSRCPGCFKMADRKYTTAIQFKGSGFYCTDKRTNGDK